MLQSQSKLSSALEEHLHGDQFVCPPGQHQILTIGSVAGAPPSLLEKVPKPQTLPRTHVTALKQNRKRSINPRKISEKKKKKKRKKGKRTIHTIMKLNPSQVCFLKSFVKPKHRLLEIALALAAESGDSDTLLFLLQVTIPTQVC